MRATRPYLERASRKAEARFFYLSALRELGSHDEYIAQTRALLADFPGDSWSEEALNNLGTHYIVTNHDEAAAQVFAELYEKFPTGSRAERAAWKSGWWSYRKGDYANTVRTFESAAASFPALGLSARPSCIGRGGRTGRWVRETRLPHASASCITTTEAPTTDGWQKNTSRVRPMPVRQCGSRYRSVTASRCDCCGAAAHRGSDPAAPRQRPV